MSRVTVFLPVYNGAAYLAGAIESILGQTFQDFEFLIVDDGSTDETPLLLEKYDDPRIRVVTHAENAGVPATRNEGLELARGEYLAMIDSDDLAHPERLAAQVDFLDRHRDHAVVGSYAREIDEHGTLQRPLSRPLGWKMLRASTLFMGTLRTPSAMGRLEILRDFRYRAEFPVCSDSDVWARLGLDYRCANLPRELIFYRIHSESITKSETDRVKGRKKAISRYLLERLGVRFDEYDLERHFRLRRPKRYEFDAADVAWTDAWLRKLVRANFRTGLFPRSAFLRVAGDRWRRVVKAAPTVTLTRGQYLRMRGARAYYKCFTEPPGD